jgi:hypothetical protein
MAQQAIGHDASCQQVDAQVHQRFQVGRRAERGIKAVLAIFSRTPNGGPPDSGIFQGTGAAQHRHPLSPALCAEWYEDALGARNLWGQLKAGSSVG